MNRTFLTLFLAVLFLFGSVSDTRAGTIWAFFGVGFDTQAQEVGGYAATYITYDLYDYYDPGTHSLLHYTDPTDIIDVDGGKGVNDYLYGYYPGFYLDITNDDYRFNKVVCMWSEHALYPIIVPTPYQGQSPDPYSVANTVPAVMTTEGTIDIPDNFVANNYSNGNYWVQAFSQICIRIPTVESVTFETDMSAVTNDNPASLGGGSRIFPGKQSHNDMTNRKTVKVKAQLAPAYYDDKGLPVYSSNEKIYFRNFDVDDPSSDSTIDSNGNAGGDNRALVNPTGTFSNCTATSNGCYGVTNSNGLAEATFTVTTQPGDNFVIAASTDNNYINGVSINGTGLKDSANQSLPTSRAKRTNLLSVWRKVHLEVDSMTTVGNNVTNGRVQDAVTVGSSPVWVDISSFTGDLEPSRFQGGQMTSGTYRFEVLDNTEDQVQIQYNNGSATLFYNSLFQLFDDDDFNDSDSPPPTGDGTLDGDDGENVTFRGANKFTETFSRLQPSTDVSLNPFAAAYIEPSYTWAEGQSGMNDENVPFELNVTRDPVNNFDAERDVTNRDRDSSGMEQDDFWIGYILIGYQYATFLDNDPTGELAFSGWSVADSNVVQNNAFTNSASSFGDVPEGAIGSLLYIEVMRDFDLAANADCLIRTVPHELGHQFGLAGDFTNPSPLPNWGLMDGCGPAPLTLVPTHINVLRYRFSSPGLPF